MTRPPSDMVARQLRAIHADEHRCRRIWRFSQQVGDQWFACCRDPHHRGRCAYITWAGTIRPVPEGAQLR